MHLSLMTDLYQLTMAQGYHRAGRGTDEGVFHVFFRTAPFGGAYAVACGVDAAIDWLGDLRFDDAQVTWLATLRAGDGTPLFGTDFLDHLAGLRCTLDVDAVAEGTVLFPNEPAIRVRGNLIEAQLAETALLTLFNFPTLIATKAARVTEAAGGGPVLEFGLRRAQGPDGGLTASRAAYIGGAAATSNVLAGQRFGVPVRGTHAHSWVMSFGDELEAFRAYAHALPNNVVLLVDTWDAEQGIRNAVTVGKEMAARGQALAGVRLDSGDLVALSKRARAELDAAGLTDARVVASNDLDEHVIADLRARGARVDTWGVGTRLVTGGEQAALGGVYKIGAVRSAGAAWRPCLKVSETPAKTSIPGQLQVRRLRDADGRLAGDVIWNEDAPPGDRVERVHAGTRDTVGPALVGVDLLQPRLRGGARPSPSPGLHEQTARARARAHDDLLALAEPHRRLHDPLPYPVALEAGLHDLRVQMIERARGASSPR